MTHIFDQSGNIDDTNEGTGEAENETADGEGAARRNGAHVCGQERWRSRRGGGRAGDGLKGKRTKARRSRSSRALSLTVMAREYIWLWDVRHGVSANEIALREGLNVQRVRIGIARAKTLEKNGTNDNEAVRPPRLIPLFPIGAYTPQSECAHHRPIEDGSLLCCMVCHCSGVDDHPGLMRSPLTDPTPEPKPAPAPSPRQNKRETRRQRRQRVFGTPALASTA